MTGNPLEASDKPNEDSLRAEYVATNDCYLNSDNFGWQVGAVLIAGTFVFWGFLLDRDIKPVLVGNASLLIAILMSIWKLYVHHTRQIYYCQLHRLHEIERLLGMAQHRRWIQISKDGIPLYRTFGLRGHELDIAIFVAISLGGPFIGFCKTGWSNWYALPLVLVIIIVAWISRNERAMKANLKRVDDLLNNAP